MGFFLVVLPLALIGSAFIASFVFVRRSTLRMTAAGVEIRNYPQPPKSIPLAQADHFEPAARSGNFSFVRPQTVTLVLVDGSRVPVRSNGEPEAGYGVEALNDRLSVLRRA